MPLSGGPRPSGLVSCARSARPPEVPMRVVYSAAHLGHDPGFEVTGGRRIAAYEVSARAESIRAALDADPAFDRSEPAEHGREPIIAVHDADLVRYLETAWDEWRRAGRAARAIVP